MFKLQLLLATSKMKTEWIFDVFLGLINNLYPAKSPNVVVLRIFMHTLPNFIPMSNVRPNCAQKCGFIFLSPQQPNKK